MGFLVLSTAVIGGFWWWARSETLKKTPRARYRRRNSPRQYRPSQLTSQQQILVWSCILGTQLVWLSRHELLATFGAVGNSGQGTGYGQVDDRNLANFPPPYLYQELGGANSVVTFINGSPDALTIRLVKDTGERLELKMPACRECSTYGEKNAPPYGAVGTPMQFQIPPGRYQATGRFFGSHNTKGFVSDWQLSQGWEYRSVIYTLDEVQFF